MHKVEPRIEVRESNLCAVSQIGDSCRGDSGGGLVRLGRYYELIGVVSYGIGCNSTVQGVKIPGVYARVTSVLNWIRHVTDRAQYCQTPSEQKTATTTKTTTTTTTRTKKQGERTNTTSTIKSGKSHITHYLFYLLSIVFQVGVSGQHIVLVTNHVGLVGSTVTGFVQKAAHTLSTLKRDHAEYGFVKISSFIYLISCCIIYLTSYPCCLLVLA